MREVVPADIGRITEVNNALAPSVNALPAEEMQRLIDLSVWTRVAGDPGAPIACLVALDGPGLPYASENYAWFSRRHERFLYVDRVFVEPASQGGGLGASLYSALIEWGTAAGYPVLGAEVNLEPANPGSLRFHERFSFRPVGEQVTKGGSVRVRMLERDLRTGQPVGGDLGG